MNCYFQHHRWDIFVEFCRSRIWSKRRKSWCSSSSLYSPLFLYINQSDRKFSVSYSLCCGSFNMFVPGAVHVVFTCSLLITVVKYVDICKISEELKWRYLPIRHLFHVADWNVKSMWGFLYRFFFRQAHGGVIILTVTKMLCT